MDQARDTLPRVGDNDEPHGAGFTPVVVPSTVATISPATASARLRAAREALGMTTADVAARTRITLRHVDALDRGALAALPGRPYVLGFVRSYAKVVGLNETELVALARTEMDRSVPKPVPRQVHQFDVDDPAKVPSSLVTWLALALFIAVLGAGGVFWRSYYAPGGELPSLAAPESTQPAAAARTAVPVVTPAAAGPVAFTARENAIWVKFYDGHGKQLLQKQLAMGESYTVPADAFEPKLWTGRPDALAITIGGQAVAPLSDRRVIVRDVPVTAQALLARGKPAATVSPAAAAPDALHATHRRPRAHDTSDDLPAAAAGPSTAGTPTSAPAAPAPAASAGGVQ